MKQINIDDVKIGDFIYLQGGRFDTINPQYFDTEVFWNFYMLHTGIVKVIQLGENITTNERALKCKFSNAPEGFEIVYQSDTALLVEDEDKDLNNERY